MRKLLFVLIFIILASFSGCIGEQENPQERNIKWKEEMKRQEQFIMVTSPNAGEVWQKGSTHEITWTSQNINGNVQIRIDRPGVSKNIASSAPNNGRYTWTIGNDVEPRSDWRVVITWYNPNGDNVWDTSDRPFTIVSKANWYDNLRVSISDTSLTFRVKQVTPYVNPPLYKGDITLPRITITNIGSETTPDFSVDVNIYRTFIQGVKMDPGAVGLFDYWDYKTQISLSSGESYTIPGKTITTTYLGQPGDAYLVVSAGKGSSSGFEPLKHFDSKVYIYEQ